MAETEFDYSVLDFERETTKKKSNSAISYITSPDQRYVTIRKSTILVFAIVAAIVLVGNGVFMYLTARMKRDCEAVFPNGYKPSWSKYISRNRSAITTNSSGCPTGWQAHNQSCYLINNDSSTWIYAMIQCMNFGGYLVEINSADEDQYLRSQARQTSGIECFKETSIKYDGLISTTFEGRSCQRWDSQYPHKHTRNNISNFPESSLSDVANFCRDPDHEGMPWCYTNDPDVRWQFCGITKCPGDFWIGLSDQTKRNQWAWVTSPTTIGYSSYTNWGTGEPSNGAGSYEHCGAFNATSDLSWSDRNCFMPAPYICEK